MLPLVVSELGNATIPKYICYLLGLAGTQLHSTQFLKPSIPFAIIEYGKYTCFFSCTHYFNDFAIRLSFRFCNLVT